MEAQLLFAWEPLPQRPGRESAGDAGCVLGRKRDLPSPTEELQFCLRASLSFPHPYSCLLPSEGFVSPLALRL